METSASAFMHMFDQDIESLCYLFICFMEHSFSSHQVLIIELYVSNVTDMNT